jgi:hypothetical protein
MHDLFDNFLWNIWILTIQKFGETVGQGWWKKNDLGLPKKIKSIELFFNKVFETIGKSSYHSYYNSHSQNQYKYLTKKVSFKLIGSIFQQVNLSH